MPRRLVILLVLVAAGGGLWLARRSTAPAGGFSTPGECVDAYYAATRAGDVAAYLRCLGEPILAEERNASGDGLVERLRRQAQSVKGWAQAGEAVDGDRATVEIDEVRLTGTCRVRFGLRRGAGGWGVVAVDRGPERPAAVPYGTHIKDTDPGPPSR
jgi:hypothetical protein